MQAVEPTAAEIRQALSGVLARPEFQQVESSRLLTWLSELRLWVLRFIMDLLRGIDLDVSGSTVVWALRGLLVLAAVVLVAQLIRTARKRGWVGSSSTEPGGPTGLPETSGEMDWAAVADRAAREGRFREAVLALYQGLLQRLEAAGVLRYDPAKTPGDYRRETRPHAAVARNLSRFLMLFEPIAFGGREPDRSAFERLRTAALEAAGE